MSKIKIGVVGLIRGGGFLWTIMERLMSVILKM